MGKRHIKKYSNRRLYDTVESRYVTLDDIRKLIASGVDVEITDDATGENITRALQLQIIAGLEFSGQPILNEQFLTQLIRFYGHPMQGFMSEYLSKSIEAFANQQKDLQARFKQAMSMTHLETMQDIANKNMEMWNAFQKSFTGHRSDDDDQQKK